MSRSGGEKGKSRARDDVSSVRHVRDGVQCDWQPGQETFALAEGEVVELAEGGGEVCLRPLGHLLQRVLVPRVEGH